MKPFWRICSKYSPMHARQPLLSLLVVTHLLHRWAAFWASLKLLCFGSHASGSCCLSLVLVLGSGVSLYWTRMLACLIFSIQSLPRAQASEKEREIKREIEREREGDAGPSSREKKSMFQSYQFVIKTFIENKAFFKCACIITHGGGVPMINNSGDNKVRVWWHGRRKKARERERVGRKRER